MCENNYFNACLGWAGAGKSNFRNLKKGLCHNALFAVDHEKLKKGNDSSVQILFSCLRHCGAVVIHLKAKACQIFLR